MFLKTKKLSAKPESHSNINKLFVDNFTMITAHFTSIMRGVTNSECRIPIENLGVCLLVTVTFSGL